MTDEQIYEVIAPFYAEGNIARAAADVSMDEYRAIEAAATAPLLDRIAEQLHTIQALNAAINGHESTTTENLTLVGRLEARIAELTHLAETLKLEAQCHAPEMPTCQARAAFDAARKS